MASKRTGGGKLNEKQRQFAKEYLIDLNATQAAIRAGYSPKAAGQVGFKLLKNDQVQAILATGRKRVEDKLDISRERIMREYARVAFSDIRNYGEWDAAGRATMKPSTDLSDDHTAAISELTVTTSPCGDGEVAYVTKMKLASKIAALDGLCKMQGYIVNKHELAGPDGAPIPVAVNLADLSDDELAALEGITKKVRVNAPKAADDDGV